MFNNTFMFPRRNKFKTEREISNLEKKILIYASIIFNIIIRTCRVCWYKQAKLHAMLSQTHLLYQKVNRPLLVV